jgi:AcrR family transcriptional regulator
MMKEKTLSRREREKIRQRKEMLAAALELFSEKGFHNVTMHEIAERSEFATGTLYKFFKNKEALYKSLLYEQTDRFDKALTKALEGPGDEIEKLRAYVEAKGRIFSENISMIRLYFAETQGASFNILAGLDAKLRRKHDQILDRLARVFEAGMEKKIFREGCAPFYLAITLDSITKAFLLLWLENPDRHPYPQDPDQILDIILKGLVSHPI